MLCHSWQEEGGREAFHVFLFTSLKNLIPSDFQEAFQLFDQKGDGRVQVSQIGDILRALGQNPTESDVKKLTHNHRPGNLSFTNLYSNLFLM